MNETETLCNGQWLRLKRRGRWEFAERVNAGGGVIIVAVTPEDRILLVEQYRAAIESKTIEMPAGLVGDLAHAADEHAVEAAQRELLEETGYDAGRIEFLMAGPSSSGMSNEIMAFVRAYDLEARARRRRRRDRGHHRARSAARGSGALARREDRAKAIRSIRRCSPGCTSSSTARRCSGRERPPADA